MRKSGADGLRFASPVLANHDRAVSLARPHRRVPDPPWRPCRSERHQTRRLVADPPSRRADLAWHPLVVARTRLSSPPR